MLPPRPGETVRAQQAQRGDGRECEELCRAFGLDGSERQRGAGGGGEARE